MKDLIEQWKKDEKAFFRGWDFSYLKNRTKEGQPPWNYIKIAKELIKKAKSILDMGTGGGEIFSEILKVKPLPKKLVATEGYKPNVEVARKTLKPLNVKVIDFSMENVRKIPFKDEEFDLILNRHDAYDIKEVYRILKKGGKFLTQQVTHGNTKEIKKVFGLKPGNKFKEMQLKIQIKEFKKMGFKILEYGDWKGDYIFNDVGALVYYLKSIPWTVPNFSVDNHLNYLEKLQKKLEKDGKLKFTNKRFYILAEK